jgi:hypothetical protein
MLGNHVVTVHAARALSADTYKQLALLYRLTVLESEHQRRGAQALKPGALHAECAVVPGAYR